MNGALMKASSRVAIAAALGLALGAGSAGAADLGGNCCADLEERVAELEATTARKGNRKMSLTITGQVNRTVLWWDDGHDSRTYYGLDNTNSSTRFSLLGEAKISARWKTGFEIMVELGAGGTTSTVNQFNEDGTFSGITGPISGAGALQFNSANNDPFLDTRRAVWWIEHKDVGRLSVGRTESAGVVNTIDLGGISVVASSSAILLNAAFFLRGSAGEVFPAIYFNMMDPASSQGRSELIRYDSPTIAGFIASASIGEAGDYWGAMLRYAGEFSGVRVAGGVGYEKVDDCLTPAAFSGTPVAAAVGANPAGFCVGGKPDISAWGAALSLLHVPSGLFVQGHYMAVDYGNPAATASLYWGQNAANKKDADQWLIQAGIAKNWTGLGNTALYGEYGVSNDWGAGLGAGRNYTVPAGTTEASTGLTELFNVTGTEVTIWGIGLVQNIDAAATELYLGWRRFSTDLACSTNCVTGAGAASNLSTSDLDVVAAGARVKF